MRPAPPSRLATEDDAVWFPGVEAPRPGAITLVCFSYAGGTPSVFRGWDERLGAGVQVAPVLLAGRCRRLAEAPASSVPELARRVASALVSRGHAQRYALFGHSMGALLAYEVACELRANGCPPAARLFVSGSKAPHEYGGQTSHALPDAELAELVDDLGGLGEDEDSGRSYLARRLPVLRADLRACETYSWSPRAPLATPITALCGTGDPVATDVQMERWREYTSRAFLRRDVPGNHFFLSGRSRDAVLDRLRSELSGVHAPAAERPAA